MDFIEKFRLKVIDLYTSIIELLPRLILSLLIVGLFLFLASLIRKRLNRYMQTKADDLLTINFLNSSFKVANVLLAIFLFLSLMGQTWIATSFLGAASISAIVIGFAFKDIAENFLAGIILAFNRPFRLGDTVKSADIEGTILKINLRDTLIKTFDGKDVFVPNGQILKNPLYNYTIDGFIRGNFSITVVKDADIDQTRQIILSAVKSVEGILLEDKPPRTHIVKITSVGLEIQVFYWLNTFDDRYSGLELKSQAIKRCIEDLDEANVNLSKHPWENISDQ